MGKCKTKAIQTEIDIFRHNQAYPGIIQAYSTQCNSSIFRAVAYPEPETYSEPWHVFRITANYFRKF